VNGFNTKVRTLASEGANQSKEGTGWAGSIACHRKSIEQKRFVDWSDGLGFLNSEKRRGVYPEKRSVLLLLLLLH
jgi:hypothetical protein